MATNARNRRLEPSYKQHAAVDDKRGVILDIEVTTGEINEGSIIEAQADAVTAMKGIEIKTVTADAGYAYGKVYGGLERRESIPSFPQRPSRYDAVCRRAGSGTMPSMTSQNAPRDVSCVLEFGRFFYSKAKDCSQCPMRGGLPLERKGRQGHRTR